MRTTFTTVLLFIFINTIIYSQAKEEDKRYVPESDTLVLQKLAKWQNLKFGLLMHWGAYSQWGIVESWSICPEEYDWCRRFKGENPDNYFLYKQEYENLKKTFNPVNFNPDKWANAAKKAGMRYVIFTTKHHDGFCMFDSKYTDYKITDKECPFSSNPKSNVAKEIFNAFRKKGFWTGAYFSKPDWHSPYYWDPAYPPKDRNVNYNPDENPEKWSKFIDFTHNQILELLSGYGKIDILWLDGGWVAKDNKETVLNWYEQELKNTPNAYLKRRKVIQDIKMDELVAKAREKQPGLIVVDRAVTGINQNYLTPENRVPDKALPYPWESCIISGGGWSYTENAKYMSGRKAIQLLVDIVAKGGNLLLNIAPSPEGTWQEGAYKLLDEYARWMNINHEAIYDSKILPPYKENNICMTQKDNGNSYFFYMADEKESKIPDEIVINSHFPSKNAKIQLLGIDTPLKWVKSNKGFKILIPSEIRNNPPCDYVWVFKVSKLDSDMSGTSNQNNTILNITTKSMIAAIDDKGIFIELRNADNGKNYISKDSISAVMSIKINKNIITPKSATYNDNILALNFGDNITANIEVLKKENYFTLELKSITNKDKIELIIWGPYINTINKIIGETVGVVRNEEFAIGIQALNIKTLGGYPWHESDRMPAFDIFKVKDTDNMYPKSDGSVLYRVEAAKPTKTGSSLQAYCRNRNKKRVISGYRHKKIEVLPYNDGGITGSKIALFACKPDEILNTISDIEIREGLPHPLIDGEWTKTSTKASSSYIITNFSENSIDKAIELTKKTGLKYLYHYGNTFVNWGHFDLNKKHFPNGIAGLRTCVDKAKAQGISLGTHVLSNFISTNDPYVTPVPDKRLAKVGSSTIKGNIDSKQNTITIDNPDFFNQIQNSSLKTVMIGDELIRYENITDKAPWKLLNCQRGAFGTKASTHIAGDTISKLADHPYKVFLSNADLTKEIAKNIASLYNKTGMRQISFDGLEGNRSTGLGVYGESLMPYTWYNELSDELKEHLIIDASRTTHFFWHIFTRMNWGEPWHAGFRESQVKNRMNNQAYFKRNFMPGMLGWFKMTPQTSIEDIEWLLARAAAYDAGFAFVVNENTLGENGNTEKILKLIKEWETIRMANRFPEKQKALMRDLNTEYTLKKNNANEYELYKVNTKKIIYERNSELSTFSFEFEHYGSDQVINFILDTKDSDISNIKFKIDNNTTIKIPVSLKAGEILKYTGGNVAFVYDKNWNKINEIVLNPEYLKIKNGKHIINFNCDFGNNGKEVKLEVRTKGKSEKISLK